MPSGTNPTIKYDEVVMEIAVSIIVPVYNGERYLKQCLGSIVSQTFSSYEVIIINDGSTDNTQSIVDDYASRYPFIRVYTQENAGIQKTRTRGLQLAKGEYIAWVDSDDFIEPNMIEKLYHTAVCEKSDVVICDYDFYPEKTSMKEKWYKEYRGTIDWYFIERNTQQWNKLISRELLEETNMAHWISYCGEGAYALALIKAKHITSISDKLYHYRVGHGSISTTLNPNWYIGDVQRTRRQREMIHESGLADRWDVYYQYRIIYSLIRSMIIMARIGNLEEYRKQREQLRELKWKANQYTKVILDHNHGKLKSFVLRHIIPLNFHIAHMVTNIVLR